MLHAQTEIKSFAPIKAACGIQSNPFAKRIAPKLAVVEQHIRKGEEIVAWQRERVVWRSAAHDPKVMPGLGPGIHVFAARPRRGWPGQARP